MTRGKRYSINHSELVVRGAHWLNKQASNIKYRSNFVVTEFVCTGVNESPDIFGLRPYGHVLIEVKTSRSDYLRDKKKVGRNNILDQLGNFRFYLAPNGLLKPNELPERWGLLEWDGINISVTVEPVFWENADHRGTHHIYYSVLRRLHKYQIFDFKSKKE